MPAKRKSTLAQHRGRMARQGFVRVEVRVHRKDAALVRRVVSALIDPAREADARARLSTHFPAGEARGLKALLAAAPLEGVDLTRPRDKGRAVAL